MQSMPGFVHEMTVCMRTLGLVASAPFNRDIDVAIATRNAQAELSRQHAQLTAAINRQIAAAGTFASIARYLQRKGPKPMDQFPDIVAADLRRPVLALKDCNDPATDALCDRLLKTHREALGVLAAQRAYLERAISTAQLSIADARIALLRTKVIDGALPLLLRARKDRDEQLAAHKRKWNGEGLAREIKKEFDQLSYLEQRGVRRYGTIHK